MLIWRITSTGSRIKTLKCRVEERISDGALHKLIERFLDQEIMEELKRWTPMGGIPQGSCD